MLLVNSLTFFLIFVCLTLTNAYILDAVKFIADRLIYKCNNNFFKKDLNGKSVSLFFIIISWYCNLLWLAIVENYKISLI